MKRVVIASVALLLAAGCAAPGISPEERSRLEAPARGLESRGDWREAAVAWQQAARAQGDTALAAEFTLNAADSFLQAGDGAGAAVVAEGVSPPSPDLTLRRTLILADAALLVGDPVLALRYVGGAVTSPDSRLLARYRRIRSDALEMSGDHVGAARERALRESLLSGTEELYRNRQRTWELLERVPQELLEAQPLTPAEPTSGWLELAAIARRHALDAPALEGAISEWSLRYPGHPAGEQIVPELIERVRVEAQPPSKVALLLPQSGPFVGAAEAVRDGFMAAWMADAPNSLRPEVIVRDSAEGDVALTYASALAEGAQFVVGPLAKETVRALLTDADLSVMTLMLNYPSADPATLATGAAADGSPVAPGITATGSVPSAPGVTGQAPPLAPGAPASDPSALAPDPAVGGGTTATAMQAVTEAAPVPRDLSRVYHFALAPEDEAARAAEFAFSQGARQAGVLAPQGPWGERVSGAFTARWQALGGLVADAEYYPEEATGLSATVEKLLNIDDSKQRAKDLRGVLVRTIEHDPEPRSDLDVIFLAAFPQAARQLKPLLLFHRAGATPVVATSHVYAGTPDPQLDQDIEGVLFGDMPWVVSPDSHPLPGSVRRYWPQAAGGAGRLYAFGADAYALIAQIREMRALPGSDYPGLTGRLSLDATRRVQRHLQWSQVRDGVPVTLDPSSQAWGSDPR